MNIYVILKAILSVLFFVAMAATVAIGVAAVIFKVTNKLDKKRNARLTVAFLIALVTWIGSGIAHFMVAFQLYNM